MKIISITFLALVTFFYGCKKDNIVKGNYDCVHYVRSGGNVIDFKVYPTDNTDSVKIVMSSYDNRDTTLQFILVDTNNNSAFSMFHKAINSQAQINGNYKQSSLLSGEWVYIYAVANGKETEITNNDLRNTLLNFETLARVKMSK